MDLETNVNDTQETLSEDENDGDNDEADVNEMAARLKQIMKHQVFNFNNFIAYF